MKTGHGHGYTGNFAIRLNAIEKVLKYKREWVTYHPQEAKVQTYQPPKSEKDQGVTVPVEEIEQNNCFQFKKHAFDAFKIIHPKRFALLEADREEEFAPVRTAESQLYRDKPLEELEALFESEAYKLIGENDESKLLAFKKAEYKNDENIPAGSLLAAKIALSR